MTAPEVPKRKLPKTHLARWAGNPLEPQNVGCALEAGTLLCLIGKPEQLEAVLIIDQGDLEFVRPGQPATIELEQQAGQRWQGPLAEVAKIDLTVAPRQLSRNTGGRLATAYDAAGLERPLSASYQARVNLNDPLGQLRPGLSGRAKIRVGQQTWWQWAYRTLCQTFQFHAN